MAFGYGRTTALLAEIKSKIGDENIAKKYLGITKIPCVIKSPLRVDNRPSFAIYQHDDGSIYYMDYATGEKGSLYSLLCSLWHSSFLDVISKIVGGFDQQQIECSQQQLRKQTGKIIARNQVALQCKVREWQSYDIDYWQSYGISLQWLKYAEVYPISHKIVIKDDKKYTFGADKYAYCFVERKEGKVTLKVYQPFNTKGFKWSNKHDRSVISLWTKVPEKGKRICICSSLKDALCLWANTGIPAISVQGEGYSMSETAINELKKRFERIYVLFDNDDPGLKDGEKLSHETGFINVVLPPFKGGKDISDYYKIKGKEAFVELIHHLIKSIDYGN